MKRVAFALVLASSCRAVPPEHATAEQVESASSVVEEPAAPIAAAPRATGPAPRVEAAQSGHPSATSLVGRGDAIAWETPDAGFARARREGRPIVLVLSATWCGHCRTYAANVLADARVVEASREFVMVRVDVDAQPDLARRFAPDGGYVPRTLFLTPDGTPRPELHAARDRYLYFVQTTDPSELLGLMARARS